MEQRGPFWVLDDKSRSAAPKEERNSEKNYSKINKVEKKEMKYETLNPLRRKFSLRVPHCSIFKILQDVSLKKEKLVN